MDRVEFNSVLALSYAGFLKLKNVTVASDEMKKQWISQTVNKMKTNSTPEEIMKFFHIPEKYTSKIMAHQYLMIEKKAKDNMEQKILFIPMSLSFTEGSDETVSESGIVLPN